MPASGGVADASCRSSATSTRPASQIDDIGLRRPTLDDVFLSLTGHASVEDEPGSAA